MTARWDQRVGAALVSQHRAPLDARLSAGVLLGRDGWHDGPDVPEPPCWLP
jgi:hypothetical protein